MQDKTMTFSIYEDKEDETRRILTPVSYTHLDVYKRQM